MKVDGGVEETDSSSQIFYALDVRKDSSQPRLTIDSIPSLSAMMVLLAFDIMLQCLPNAGFHSLRCLGRHPVEGDLFADTNLVYA